jgi:hypothetical protein
MLAQAAKDETGAAWLLLPARVFPISIFLPKIFTGMACSHCYMAFLY